MSADEQGGLFKAIFPRREEGLYKRVFHPTDLSRASEAAFAHALKIALAAKAEISIYHVALDTDDVDGADFPSVRNALVQWGVLPAGSERKEVGKLGLRVKKIKGSGHDPVHVIARRLERKPTDLMVLTTGGEEGLPRWLHKAVAEPVARGTRTMTLFVPNGAKGFVSMHSGGISLQRVLIPVDRHPSAQPAVTAAARMARGLGCTDVNFILVYVGADQDVPTLSCPTGPGWRWQTLTTSGEVVKQISHFTDRFSVDLVALTTKGHDGLFDALRGSTTERIVRSAHCPVLAIPVFQ